MSVFDCHTHTDHSHDSKCPLDESCARAWELGLAGLCVTDHADVEYARVADVRGAVRGSFLDAQAHKEAWAGRLKILAGVEIGEELWDRDAAAWLREDSRFDVILGSIHAVRMEGYMYPFSRLDFSKMPPELLPEFLHRYFADMLEMVETTDVDVLCHPTVPLRYITGKYGIPVDPAVFDHDVDLVLRAAAAKDLAFELNTSCTGTAFDSLPPDVGYAARFMAYGGRKFSLGSDAHTPERLGIGFERALGLYRSIGVHTLTYFEGRRPCEYEI